jgi:hypothetical protein
MDRAEASTTKKNPMAVSRRRLIQSLALTAGCCEGAGPALSLDALRQVSAFQGTNLSDDRLRVLKPVLERRLADLRALRDFEIDDSVAPVHGSF